MKYMRKKVLTRSLMAIICSAALAVPLAGCGGSSSGEDTNGNGGDTSEDGGETEDGAEISSIEGSVVLPGVDEFEQGDELSSLSQAMRLAGGFLMSTAQAQETDSGTVTYQGPYFVQLTRINPDGSVEVIRDREGNLGVRVSATGGYSLQLPEALDLTANLVLRVVTENVEGPAPENIPLRSVTTGESVDIDPVSEFLVRELDRANVDLANLAVNEVVRLRGQIADPEIAEGATLEHTLAAIEGEYSHLRSDIEDLNTPVVSADLLNGENYTLFLLGKGLGVVVEYDVMSEGIRIPEVTTELEKDANVAFSASGDEIVAGVDASFSTFARINPQNPNGIGLDQDLTGDSDEIPGIQLRDNGVLRIPFPLEEELASNDFAIRALPVNLRLQGVPAALDDTPPYAFVGANKDTQLFFGREDGGDGAIDLDRPRGKRDEILMDILVHNDGGTPNLQDRYGIVRMSFNLDLDNVGEGCSEAVNEAILAERDQGNSFKASNAVLADDAALNSNCDTFVSDPFSDLDIDIQALANGRINIETPDGSITGTSEPEGRFWAIGDFDDFESNGLTTYTESALLLGVSVDEVPPSVNGTTWHFHGMDALYGDGNGFGPAVVGGNLGSTVTFCDGDLVLDPSRFLDIERQDVDPVVDADDFGATGRLQATISTMSDGAIVVDIEDSNEIFQYTGFVSADEQMMVLAERTLEGGSTTAAGLTVAVRAAEDDANACSIQ